MSPEAQRVDPFDIERMTNTDDRFYALVGPWLSRREVVAELGDQMWDDDGKEWFVAIREAEFIGCVAVKDAHVCSFYVTKPHRKNVVGATLLMRALMAHGAAELTATSSPAAVDLFTDCGFKSEGMRGKFTLMRRGAE